MRTRQIERGGVALGKAVTELYQEGQTDYSIEPIVLTGKHGEPVGLVQNGDAVIFCCRRGEREVQLTEAFAMPHFDRFPRPPLPNLDFVILTLYHEKFKDLHVAFAPAHIDGTLAEAISCAGLRQFHTAESEKFAHVTFFFNGGSHRQWEGETDLCIPSPKDTPFEQIPALSLPQVAGQVRSALEAKYDFIVANFANGDVIGHTANRQAKIECASIVDTHLGRTVTTALEQGYVVFVTADHGNLEELRTLDGSPHVSHTANPVQLIVIDPCHPGMAPPRAGSLADLAPTILAALGLPPPREMSGANLCTGYDWCTPRRVLLLILDGWGIGKDDANNPIFLARTPVWDRLTCRYAHSVLQAAGEAVGLQTGKAGNSEAGHMNMGAGRLVLQDDVRLELAMQDGSFYSNAVLCQALTNVKRRGKSLHLIGLLTEKSSHGCIDYPLALLRLARQHDIEHAYLHVIFDGRSTKPGSAPALLAKLEGQMETIGAGQVASGMGRAIALDRDGNYDRTRRAFEAMVCGTGRHFRVD